MWYGLKQLHQFGVTIICHPALPAEMVVVRWDELAERHAALMLGFYHVHSFATELSQLLTQHGTATETTVVCKKYNRRGVKVLLLRPDLRADFHH